MEQIYAKILLPLEDYSTVQIKEVAQDPLHKEFLEFKEEIMKKVGAALEQEEKENNADLLF